MRNTLLIFSLFVGVFSSFSQTAMAQEGVITSIHHQYQSNRALGMGDAFVANANDYSALFYNPAGLARRDSGQINLSIEFGGGLETNNFYKDLDVTTKATYADDTAKFQAYASFLQKYYGKPLAFRTGLLEAIWVRENWGIGLIPLDLTFEGQIHNQAAPALDVRAIADTTFAYGYGDEIKGIPGRLSWGTTAKFINRGYINREVNALDLAADPHTVKKEDMRDGYTLDFDLGVLYSPEIPSDGILSVFQLAKPTFGAVARNVLDYGFGQSFHLINKTTVEAPEKLHRVLDVGAKFEYPELWIFGGRGEVDIRDIGHPYFSWRKAFHLGFEFDWTISSWWRGHYRAGLNQLYPTFGVSAQLFIFNLDVVTYGEDVGTYGSPKENRMYMAKLNIDL
jgi:hypothetical protein